MLRKVRNIRNNNIGPRTVFKSLSTGLKVKAYNDGKSLSSFLLNGNTQTYLEKNAKVLNYGKFWLGIISRSISPPSKLPCALQMFENSQMIINGNVSTAQGVLITVTKNAHLELGDGVFVNSNSKIICFNNIRIGNGSVISWDVEIRDSDVHRVLREGYLMSKPIEIGSNVWIGSRATILKGVRIGSGSIIATGAIVTRDVPENSLVAGVPGRIIRENVAWDIPPDI